jgi:hypothetical protein
MGLDASVFVLALQRHRTSSTVHCGALMEANFSQAAQEC